MYFSDSCITNLSHPNKMLPEDQQIKSKYKLVRQITGETRAVRELFEDKLKMPVEIWERPISEAGADDLLYTHFENEAQILSIIKHDSILSVYDSYSRNGSHYLATEVTGGNNLQELFGEKPEIFTFPNVLEWSKQLIGAIGFLHSQSPTLIHSEIKPENIILTPNGKIKMLPFSIRPRTATKEESRTQQFDTVRLYYLPLEQIWSSLDSASQKTLLRNYDEISEQILRRPVDEQSDIYALAATLYYLFTQRPPIDALERSIDLLEGKKDPLIAASALNSAVPPAISDLLVKALAIKREDRLTSLSMIFKAVGAIPGKTQTVSGKPKAPPVIVKAAAESADIRHSASPKPLSNPISEFKKEIKVEEIENLLDNFGEQKVNTEIKPAEKVKSPAPPKLIEELLAETTAKEQVGVQVLESKYHSVADVSADEAQKEETSILNTELPVSTSENSPAVFENFFPEPPRNGHRRMGMIALVLALLFSGSALTIWKAGLLNPASAQQTVSAEKPVPTSAQPNDSPTIKTETTATVEQEAPLSVAEKAETSAGKVETITPKSEIVRDSGGGGQVYKTRSVAPPPQVAKQTASPARTAPEKKNNVTVDDLINDN